MTLVGPGRFRDLPAAATLAVWSPSACPSASTTTSPRCPPVARATRHLRCRSGAARGTLDLPAIPGGVPEGVFVYDIPSTADIGEAVIWATITAVSVVWLTTVFRRMDSPTAPWLRAGYQPLC